MVVSTEIGFELMSGMYIPNSPERNRLNDIQIAAHRLVSDTQLGLSSTFRTINEIAHSVEVVDGIEIIEEGDYRQDHHYRCGHYAFGVVMGESWATPRQGSLGDLWETPMAFLEQRGYEMVQMPKAGDIIAYTDASFGAIERGEDSFRHFGILNLGRTVVSKFNQGPIVSHPIDLVPSSYGDSAYFFQRESQ